jgi:hypothetical protein
MPKTITLRVDDTVYDIVKKASDGERRPISNFIEYATLSYITNEISVSDQEMKEILSDPVLVKELRKGLQEVKKGKYKIVE